MKRTGFAVIIVLLLSGLARAEDPVDSVKRLEKELDALRQQVEQMKKRNSDLADDLRESRREHQKAIREAEEGKRRIARLSERLRSLADELDKGIHPELPAANPDLSRRGDKNPTVIPESIRGTVTTVRDKYVAINVGLDAGLKKGAILDLYRDANGGRYLGTVAIDSVYPKEAVGIFRPADARKPLKDLPPDDRPKIGDMVGRIGSGNK